MLTVGFEGIWVKSFVFACFLVLIFRGICEIALIYCQATALPLLSNCSHLYALSLRKSLVWQHLRHL